MGNSRLGESTSRVDSQSQDLEAKRKTKKEKRSVREWETIQGRGRHRWKLSCRSTRDQLPPPSHQSRQKKLKSSDTNFTFLFLLLFSLFNSYETEYDREKEGTRAKSTKLFAKDPAQGRWPGVFSIELLQLPWVNVLCLVSVKYQRLSSYYLFIFSPNVAQFFRFKKKFIKKKRGADRLEVVKNGRKKWIIWHCRPNHRRFNYPFVRWVSSAECSCACVCAVRSVKWTRPLHNRHFNPQFVVFFSLASVPTVSFLFCFKQFNNKKEDQNPIRKRKN